ncbi:hypothetical protein KR222_003739 [Zaprionus bogoriensis]|nr:hypothetical protein KR222_003739 [Zaprionus bogoriensis]
MWAEQMELDALQQVYCLTDKQHWSKLIALGKTLDQQLKRKILWVWPTGTDLRSLHGVLEELGIRIVLSIGCGSGLLEWLLTTVGQSDKALSIFGLERDPNWWRSRYAVRSFIPLNYIEQADSKLDANFLMDCCSGIMPCALLFCYFNNRQAFLEYLSVFGGRWLILIGPQPDLGIHTDPNPLQPQLPDNQWALHGIINWTEQNVVALYRKLE